MKAIVSSLEAWEKAHSLVATYGSGETINLADQKKFDLFLLKYEKSENKNSYLRLEIEILPSDSCSSAFTVMHWGRELLSIDPNGEIVLIGFVDRFEVRRDERGHIFVLVDWFNEHEGVFFGLADLASGRARYAGAGKAQWAVHSVTLKAIAEGVFSEADRITVLDVGARSGLGPNWSGRGNLIRPVLIEPEPVEAEALARRYAGSGGVVVAVGLSDIDRELSLYETSAPTCSSLHLPNFALLKEFPAAAHWFRIKGETRVATRRYDSLVESGAAPVPDVVKVDVQGFEFEVLEGMGELLKSVLAIELETHIYRMYRNQKLLHDIVALLDSFGFRLHALREQNSRFFKGQTLEFNAFFLRVKDFLDAEQAKKKLQVVRGAWKLPTYQPL